MKNVISITVIALYVFCNILKAQPIITSFTPSSGQVNSSVTIYGNNFSSTPNNNIIYFGSVNAMVNSSSTSQLNVTVPVGATFQSFTATNLATSLTGYSQKPFSTILDQSIIAGFFASNADFTCGTNPYSIKINDLEGDGKPDVICVNFNSNTISIFKNTSIIGTFLFAPAVNLLTGSHPGDVSVADFNGDGKPDIIVTNKNSYSISVYRNVSIGGIITFDSKIDCATNIYPNSISIEDLDKDGKPDIAIGYESSGNVSVFKNMCSNGNISFLTKVDFVMGNTTNCIDVCDMDGDGKPDIVSTPFSVLRNISTIGNISFAPVVSFPTNDVPISISIRDINADGKPDVVGANFNFTMISIFKNSSTPGTLSFLPDVYFSTGLYPKCVSISNLNGDDKPDIVVSNTAINTITVLINTSTNGNISYAPGTDYTVGDHPLGLVIGDIDGDTFSDIVVANSGTNTFSILKNIGFVPQPNITFSPDSGPVGTIVTIFGSNFDTLISNNVVYFGASKATVVSGSQTQLTVEVPYGSTFQPISITNLSTGLIKYSNKPFITTLTCVGTINQNSFSTKVDFTTGSMPYGISSTDFNNDGKPDLVVNNYGTTTISILKNTSINGIVSFAPKVDIAAGNQPISINTCDLDGDGMLDILVTNYNSFKFSVFRNTSSSGTISFNPKIDFTTGYGPISVSIGDLDNDGKTDVVITNNTSNTISIFRNTSTIGNISFAAKIDIPTNQPPLSVHIADLDGDYKPDIMVANSSISIFKNTSTIGNITFGASQDFSVGMQPAAISTHDFDYDGKKDIVVANYSSQKISVLKNKSPLGTISFEPKVDFPTLGCTKSISLGDIDGDGKPDIATNSCSNKISVLKNSSTPGNISFDTKVDFIVDSPEAVLICDIDSDGKPDLVAVNDNNNTISILRNTVQGPVMTSQNTVSICNGGILNIPLTSTMNTTYNWSATDNPNTIGESTSAQSSNMITDTIINTSSNLQTITYFVTPIDTNGVCVGLNQLLNVTINIPLTSTTNITGSSSVCKNQNGILYSVPINNNISTYAWTLPVGANGTSTSNTISVNYGPSAISGNILVNGINSCGNVNLSSSYISVNHAPPAAGVITGISTVCPGQDSVLYSVPIIPDATSYIWILPGGATGTSTSNSIYVNYGLSAISGNITVKGANICGNGTVSTFPIIVNILPAGAGLISGPTTVCQGLNSYTYTVAPITNASTYFWSLPLGAIGSSLTNSIVIQYDTSAVSGNIAVQGINSCGNGNGSAIPITVNKLPGNASIITGDTSVCKNQYNVTYSVPQIANAITYVWTLPYGVLGSSNTNSITVNYGSSSVSGVMSVKGTSSCGEGASSSLPIVVNAIPITPVITNNGNILHSDAPFGNQWFDQNGIIIGATYQDYSVLENAYYYVIVTINGCISGPSNTIYITDAGMGIKGNNDIINVYPNPALNELIIEIKGSKAIVSFNIINDIGQIILNGDFTGGIKIPIEKYAPGIYFIKLENGRTHMRKKIIIE